MEILPIFLPILVAYLLGSIPTAVWVGKTFYHVDVRNEGSGNAGATNTIRVLGVKAGIPVIIVDVFKGYAAVAIAPWIVQLAGGTEASPVLLLFVSAAVVLGHTFPLYAGFRGGKGVATLLGVGIGLFPAAAGIAVLVFAAIFIISGYVSLSSITAGVGFPVTVFLFFPPPHVSYYYLAVAVAVFIPLTHRKNIKRLWNGTESKISFKKKKV
ncbi:MAG: glycerol-3-phosphate 1-O-acyltransferase PlsY [Bacteroidales bacterium]|jgi:glycerol-3-phosphate acyltransferase PlsY